MKYDLVFLLSTILKDAGLSNVIDKDLTNHSTISLNMKDDIPTINICEDDDQVWVWARICEYNIQALNYASDNIFNIMFNYNEDVFYCGQPCLYAIDGYLELRTQVKDKFLQSPDDFLILLDYYLTTLQDYRNALV